MANININELLDSFTSQFRDLGRIPPGLWPIVPRILSGLGLTAFVVLVGWYFQWSGQQEELERGQQEEQTLKDAYKQKMQQAIGLDALIAERQLVVQYVAKMEKQLPSKAEMDALLKEINQAGQGRGIQFELFKPDDIVVKDYYAEQPINIRLVGGYHDLGEFVSDIAKLPRIVTLNNLAISMNKDSSALSLEVLAKTFRYLDPEEIAAQASVKKDAKKGAKK